MGDLYKMLFEDLPEPDDELMRILDAAERVEKLEVKKQPLADALKALDLEGSLQVTPDGVKLVFADDLKYHAAVKLLGTMQIITQLAGNGWVPVVQGDSRTNDESGSYSVSFLEVDDVPMSSDTTAPSSEELALTVAKFNGFADQDAKAVEPPMQGNARGLAKKKKNEATGECTYHAFYKGKKMELTAPSSYAAQQKAAVAFKARKSYDVNVVLVGRADGSEVVHKPQDVTS